MKLPAALNLTPATRLKSGQIYRFRVEHKCYRINEPDHFLQNLRVDFFGYLDAQERIHHFNRPVSNLTAETPLRELLLIPAIQSFKAFEVPDEAESAVSRGRVPAESAEEGQALALLQKVAEAFPAARRTADAAKFDVALQEWLLEAMPDYVDSPDLPI
jgi:hypothetical protein